MSGEVTTVACYDWQLLPIIPCSVALSEMHGLRLCDSAPAMRGGSEGITGLSDGPSDTLERETAQHSQVPELRVVVVCKMRAENRSALHCVRDGKGMTGHSLMACVRFFVALGVA